MLLKRDANTYKTLITLYLLKSQALIKGLVIENLVGVI